MSTVAVILPCYGRYGQTLQVAALMRQRAGRVDAEWWAVGGTDEESTVDALVDAGWLGTLGPAPRLTYWQALAHVTERSTARVLCAVSNDVWAGEAWLERGLGTYRRTFPDGHGLVGFAGDGHGVHHSCHFLIGRTLLGHLGGWPTWYRHNFGDTELCLRATALGRYAKAIEAVLEHRHPARATAPDDTVYQVGRAGWSEDEVLFARRRASGWQ